MSTGRSYPPVARVDVLVWLSSIRYSTLGQEKIDCQVRVRRPSFTELVVAHKKYSTVEETAGLGESGKLLPYGDGRVS